jgi:pimeloyl-ACP methyl ester carboxylesterase
VFAAFDEAATIASLATCRWWWTAAHRTAPGLAPSELDHLDAAWATGQAAWAARSSDSTVVTVEGTGHHIQLEQPDRVIAAVRGVAAP